MLSIKKPSLVLNTGICLENIRAMAAKARLSKVAFRPHFKTHQSATIGEWFRNEGVTSITVSSVSMAKYFADHGWKDITIAFPVNLLEIDEINELAGKIQLNLLVESSETALFLSENLKYECSFLIKIDTGYHRTGIGVSNIMQIDSVLQSAKSPLLRFKGFLVHSGNTYQAKNIEEIIQIQRFTAENLVRLKKRFSEQYPDLILSVGDTPTCSQLLPAEGINEIRPGNFVFFDVMQFALGSCSLDQVAVALICPVVAVHHNRLEAVIYGGAIHLSKEQITLSPDNQAFFGLAVNWNGNIWDTSQLLGKVRSLSQEHGIISLTQVGCNLKPGDLVAILPVHSCLAVNLMRRFYTSDGCIIDTMNQQ
jgi:D-serine deaminase-like pyridoxal phosphate-dependent protein